MLAVNLNTRNEQIRKYVRDNRKILYDFVDIESYNPDNVSFLNQGANDKCEYKDGNWCIEWQNSHTRGVDWYQTDTAHSQPLIGNLKAYGAWYLWSRLGAGTEATSVLTNPSLVGWINILLI